MKNKKSKTTYNEILVFEDDIPIPLKMRFCPEGPTFMEQIIPMKVGQSVWIESKTRANTLRTLIWRVHGSSVMRPAVKDGVSGFRVWRK